MALATSSSQQRPAFGSRSATAMWGAFLAAASNGAFDGIGPQVVRHLRTVELVGFSQKPCKDPDSTSRIPSLAFEASSVESSWFLSDHVSAVIRALEAFAGESLVGVEFLEPCARKEWELDDASPGGLPCRLDTRRRPSTNCGSFEEHILGVPTRILLNHIRWELTETYGPWNENSKRLACWWSPALSSFLAEPGRDKSLAIAIRWATGLKVGRRRHWDPDDWGDIDMTHPDNRLILRLIGPESGNSPSDVVSILRQVDDRFLIDRSASVAPYAPVADLARQLRATPEGTDLVLAFRGGGLEPGDYYGRPGAALREAAEAVRARGTTVVLGIGHGAVRRRLDGRVLHPRAPFGVHELTTPSLAALWIVENFVGIRRAAELGYQYPGLSADADAWWNGLGRAELQRVNNAGDISDRRRNQERRLTVVNPRCGAANTHDEPPLACDRSVGAAEKRPGPVEALGAAQVVIAPPAAAPYDHPPMADLEPGLYDRLVDGLLASQLDQLAARRLSAELAKVDPAELPRRFGELVGHWARQTLAATKADDRAEAVVELSRQLSAWFTDAGLEAEATSALVDPVQRLTAIEPLSPTDEPLRFEQPRTPLRDTVLITNARGEPSLLHELESEIHSAERIDLVLAFIRHSGIRPLLPKLARHVEAGKPLRVLTTIYTGSTELRALEALVDLGAEVKVSFDTTTTRLHAKAWLFERRTGFSTVYIGSSNLTHSAQVTGQEWNVRASQHTNPDLIAAFGRSFDTYWEDRHFEPFDRDQFVAATKRERADDSILTPFSIEPFPFQRRILEQLQVARANGRPHNLVVAATGTGKTVMAALDYRALRGQLDRSRLLFVAHRKEILDQSRATFRHVLRDGSFGERWVDGDRPEHWDHVFASVQSIGANDVTNIDPTQFDVVIVDEFHHAAAASYDALLEHLRPTHLLGLTATPERADGQSVLHHFGDDITVELRLWDALEEGLLAPFHYFGIHDGTDLSDVPWRRGAYDTAELLNLYSADDVWASKIVQEVLNKIGEPLEMRALGFCVS